MYTSAVFLLHGVLSSTTHMSHLSVSCLGYGPHYLFTPYVSMQVSHPVFLPILHR